jgi:hypothetical protein
MDQSDRWLPIASALNVATNVALAAIAWR